MTPPVGWAAAPELVVGAAIIGLLVCLLLLAWERRRDQRAHEASRAFAAAQRERDADEVVRRYLAAGLTPDAVRKAAHGGRLWCAAIDRALERATRG